VASGSETDRTDGARPAYTRVVGSPSSIHGRALSFGRRQVILCHPTEPALVLGRALREDGFDQVRMSQARVGQARRASGGGAVLVRPRELVWVDVCLPLGDPLWEDDVSRAFGWLGGAWAEVLAGLGISYLSVHHGPMVRTAWSARLCLAGLGPGEVSVGGRKVVGLSQRRTRQGAVFHCAALISGDVGEVASLLAGTEDERLEAAACCRAISATLTELAPPAALVPPAALAGAPLAARAAAPRLAPADQWGLAQALAGGLAEQLARS
jgi:lipoate-protein ligase A